MANIIAKIDPKDSAPVFTHGAPKVYAAIAAVMSDIGKEGIAKTRENATQHYAFRGIDDVYNALSPILSRHNLCMLPRILSREVVERQTKNGGAMFSVTVEAEFDLICSEDGTMHTIRTFGEAMDSGDKATNKAMSAAYKYAAMQAFAIPTEGDNDADADTPEVVPSAAPAKAASKDTQARALFTQHEHAIRNAKTRDELRKVWDAAKADKGSIPLDWQKDLVKERDAKLEAIEMAEQEANTPRTRDPVDADDFPGDMPRDYVEPNFDDLPQDTRNAVNNFSAG